MIGLIIKTDGFLNLVKYKEVQDFEKYVINFETYRLLEIHKVESNTEYRIYGKLLGYNFNKFEFQSCNPTGDTVVIKTNLFGKPKDLDLQEFLDYYQEVDDLDDLLIYDELEYKDNDEYEINDFVVEDDMKSYMEYKLEHK